MRRQRTLAGRIEQAFGFEPGLELVIGAAQCAFAGFFHVVEDQLVVAAGFIQGQAATHQYAHAFARDELQPLAFGFEHRRTHLRAGILQGEVQVPGSRPADTAQFAFHPDHRERALQKIARQGVELVGGEDVVAGGHGSTAMPIGRRSAPGRRRADGPYLTGAIALAGDVGAGSGLLRGVGMPLQGPLHMFAHHV